jgi:hypothetical protein
MAVKKVEEKGMEAGTLLYAGSWNEEILEKRASR